MQQKTMEEGGVDSKSREGTTSMGGVVVPCTVDELRLGKLVRNQSRGDDGERDTGLLQEGEGSASPPSMEERRPWKKLEPGRAVHVGPGKEVGKVADPLCRGWARASAVIGARTVLAEVMRDGDKADRQHGDVCSTLEKIMPTTDKARS
jgi:hypothetical protein